MNFLHNNPLAVMAAVVSIRGLHGHGSLILAALLSLPE